MLDCKIKNSQCFLNKCAEKHSQCYDIKSGLKQGDLQSGLLSDHIVHGGDRLHTVLAFMFSAMINHSYVPKNLLLSSIIPIPKDRRKSLNDINNYRSVVMCSALGKLFDNIVVHKFKDVFKTCDLQYGLKKGHSTNQCSFIVNEVVQYYRNNDSNIYLTLLDASKAFDKVKYNKLFQLLIQKGMCPLYCKFIATLYTSQLLNVKWENKFSDVFKVHNDVQHGGCTLPSVIISISYYF